LCWVPWGASIFLRFLSWNVQINTFISFLITVVLQLWWNYELTKYWQNSDETFGNILSPPWTNSLPPKILVEKIHIGLPCSPNILIFAKILKLQYLSKFWRFLRIFWKIGPKFSWKILTRPSMSLLISHNIAYNKISEGAIFYALPIMRFFAPHFFQKCEVFSELVL